MITSDFDLPIVLIGLGIASLLTSAGMNHQDAGEDAETLQSLAVQRRVFRAIAYVFFGVGGLILLVSAFFGAVGIPGAP